MKFNSDGAFNDEELEYKQTVALR